MIEINKNKLYTNSLDQIITSIKACTPLTWIVTYEENRLIKELISDERLVNCNIWYWSLTSGIVDKFADYAIAKLCSGSFEGTQSAAKAIEKIKEYNTEDDKPLIVIMRDLHIQMADPLARLLRDNLEVFAGNQKRILAISPFLAHVGGSGLHPLLEKQTTVVDYSLPTPQQISEHIAKMVNKLNKTNNSGYTNGNIYQITRALQGLTMTEIDTALATSLVKLQRLDPEILLQEKKQLVRKNQLLEFIDVTIQQEDVGGLDLAKEYLTRYGNCFTPEAEKYGVEPLKGIIFTGIPGVGKSLIVKSMGHLWKLPVLRLDVGKIMGSLVGSSELNMRQAIATAEACAPVILFLDEMEKGLSGTKSSGQSDGGTLARVFGTLLTAMQEGLKGVTVAATCNDISQLPPELIRRFNEIFFTDLPGPEEIWEILTIHLRKRKRSIKKFMDHKNEIVKAFEGFTGAEIEKVVKDAIAMAFYNQDKDINLTHLIRAINETKPISKVQGEKIKELQKWAKEHARYASSYILRKNNVNANNEESLKIASRFDKINN